MSHGLNRLLYCLIFIFLYYTYFFPIENEEILQFYQDILLNPMDLNTTRIEYLNEVLKLPESNLCSLENYRKHSYFNSIYELTNFGLSLSRIDEISPYITVGRLTNKELSMLLQTSSYLKEVNDTNNFFSFLKTEVKVRNCNFYYGVKSYTNLIDENPAVLLYNSRWIVNYENEFLKLFLGDYTLSFGQGLLFGSPSISEITKIYSSPVYKKSGGLTGYKNISLNSDFDNDGKDDYLRGVGLKFNIDEYIFPILCGGYQVISNGKSTNMNITAALLVKRDYEVGAVYNIENAYLNSGTLFFDFLKENFHPYGELAYSDDLSFALGNILSFDKLKITTFFYYSGSNFNPSISAGCFDYSKNTSGFFAGYRQTFGILFFQCYLHLYKYPLYNSEIFQKYEAKVGFDYSGGIFSTLYGELKSRYSQLKTTSNIRNYLYFDMGFFENRALFQFRWENLLELLRNEIGNMLLIRLVFKPMRLLTIKFREIVYSSESYFSALFYPEEPFYPGNFIQKAFYGVGNEFSTYIECGFNIGLKVGVGYSYDAREKNSVSTLVEHRICCYIESLL